MERLKEIKEKGIDSIKSDDISVGLGVITEFINTNLEAQNLIKNMELTGYFDIEGEDNYILSISNGKCEYAKKNVDDASFSIFSGLKSIIEILIGKLDVSLAFITGDIEVTGDFEKMVDFFEIIELAHVGLGFIKKEDQKVLLDAKTMRKFYNIYMEGAKDIDPNDIPLVFDIFTTFANLNKEAQEILEDEDALIQMKVPDVGFFVIKIEDGKMSWSDKKIDNPELEFELSLETAADLLLSGDAASAFMAGKIEASGNIAQALVMNDVIQAFLDLLPFTEKND
ncbi:MAG: SCP2 sterol-binding domain-containing protein [Promethearchaeota archaeon]